MGLFSLLPTCEDCKKVWCQWFWDGGLGENLQARSESLFHDNKSWGFHWVWPWWPSSNTESKVQSSLQHSGGMEKEFIDHSLQYLAEVWELFSCRYLMPDSPPTALLNRVREGCFIVIWLVPSNLIPPLMKAAKTDTDFFHQCRISKVTVGYQCIYDEESNLISSV